MKRFISVIAAGFIICVSSCIGARTSNGVVENVDSILSTQDTVLTESPSVSQPTDLSKPLPKERKLIDLLTLLVAIVAIAASVVELLMILRLRRRNEDRLDSHSDRIKSLELYSLEKSQVTKLIDSSFQKFIPSIETIVQEHLDKTIATLPSKNYCETVVQDSDELPPHFSSDTFYGDYNPSYNGFPLDYLEKNSGKAFVIETVSETEANYRLVDDIPPTMIQSALAGCISDGDPLHYNRIVNTQDGTLSLDRDMNAWIVKQKVHIVFK